MPWPFRSAGARCCPEIGEWLIEDLDVALFSDNVLSKLQRTQQTQ